MFRQTIILAAIGFGLVGLCAGTVSAQAGEAVTATAATPAVGESLLRFADVKIDRDGKQAPRGFWTGVGLGKGSFSFATDASGVVIATMRSEDGPARLQYGTACVSPAIERYWGQVIEVSIDVKGNVTSLGATTGNNKGSGAVLQIQVAAPAGARGKTFQRGPNAIGDPGKIKLDPKAGEFDWTTLRAVFRVPTNTTRVDLLAYLNNSEGELQWKNPKMNVVAPSTPSDETLPESFTSAAEAAKVEAQRMRTEFDRLMAEIIAQVNVPPAAEIYSVPADLATRRPRLYVHEGLTLENLKQRWTNPKYQQIVSPLKRYADTLAAAYEKLPATQNVDVEDPLRGWSDTVTLLSVCAALTDDQAQRDRWFDASLKWIDKLISYGVTPRNLPLAQMQLAFSLTYDWHFDRLTPQQRQRIRDHLVKMAAQSYDFGSAQVNWIFGRQFVANHLWFNYQGRTVTSLALWGEQGVDQSVLRQYLDDAAINYYIVGLTHSPEGMPHEGFLYQDYGLRPYTDFLSLTEHTMGWKTNLIDKPANRTMGVRIHAMLPGERGFMVTSDSKPEQFSGYPYFHWVASRFKEPVAQALAESMRKKAQAMDANSDLFTDVGRPNRFTDINSWRSLLYFDADIQAAEMNSLPLHFGDANMGFYTARSNWTDDAAFFGLKCGTLSGKEVSKKFGPKLLVAVSGHCYPEQGNFVLQIGATDYLPNVEYSRSKSTANHNLLLFEGKGKQDGLWVGQLGSGGEWFLTKDYLRNQREAQVLEVRHADDHHYYLCDIGGLYGLDDATTKDGLMFPTYRRELTFLTDGVVAVVDHVRLDSPRAIRLNLLTGGVSGQVKDDRVSFAFKDKSTGLILTASDVKASLEAKSGEVRSWGRNDRYVVTRTTVPESAATLVSVIGPESVVGSMSIEQSEGKWLLKRQGKPPLTIGSAAAMEVARP